MTRPWLRLSTAAAASLFAALAAGCGPKPEAAPDAPPTPEQAQAARKAGEAAAAGQAALHSQQGQPPK